jgi:hypothetical protein
MTGRHAHATEHAVCVKYDTEEEKQNEAVCDMFWMGLAVN